MTDAKLRELERRWRETGAVEDETAYLQERVRAGTLDDHRLALAATMGCAGARRVLGLPDHEALEDPQEIAKRLSRWGKEALVRTAFAFARQVLPLWNAAHCDDLRPRQALECVEAWVEAPTEENERQAGEAALAAHAAADLETPYKGGETAAGFAARACAHAANSVHLLPVGDALDDEGVVGRVAWEAQCALESSVPRMTFSDEAFEEAGRSLLRGLKSVLVAWALQLPGEGETARGGQ